MQMGNEILFVNIYIYKSTLIILTKDTTKGAKIEPILAHMLLAPIPMFLTTVGNNSPEKR